MTCPDKAPVALHEFIHMSLGGPDREIRDEYGVRRQFEMHRVVGPQVLSPNEKTDEQPHQESSFWRVTSWWAQQGQRIGGDGLCIWTKPEET